MKKLEEEVQAKIEEVTEAAEERIEAMEEQLEGKFKDEKVAMKKEPFSAVGEEMPLGPRRPVHSLGINRDNFFSHPCLYERSTLPLILSRVSATR